MPAVRVGNRAAPARRIADEPGPSREEGVAVLGLDVFEDVREKREEKEDKGEVADSAWLESGSATSGSCCESGRWIDAGVGVPGRTGGGPGSNQ